MPLSLKQLGHLVEMVRRNPRFQKAFGMTTSAIGRTGRAMQRYPGATAGIVTGVAAGGAVGVRRRNKRQWSRDLNAGMSVTVPGGLLKRYERRGFPNRYTP